MGDPHETHGRRPIEIANFDQLDDRGDPEERRYSSHQPDGQFLVGTVLRNQDLDQHLDLGGVPV